MKELLEEFLLTHGPSGSEAPVRAKVIEKLGDGWETDVDRLGNLILTMGDGEPHMAVLAHMDELGFVITNMGDTGHLHFKKVGGIDDRMLPGSEVLVLGEYGPVTGVIGILPPHLTVDRSKRERTAPSDELYIDVGADSVEDARAMGISVSTYAVFEKRLRVMAHDIVSCRGIDNRCGVAVLVSVAERLKGAKLKGRLSLVWSVQEEVGLRGAQVIGRTLKPDYMLAVDTCSATDIPGVPSRFSPVKVGGGPVLRLFDNRALASPAMREVAERVAAERGMPLQVAVTGGSTDAAAVQESGSAMLPVGIPVRYTHSKVECASLTDMEQSVSLVAGMVEKLLCGG